MTEQSNSKFTLDVADDAAARSAAYTYLHAKGVEGPIALPDEELAEAVIRATEVPHAGTLSTMPLRTLLMFVHNTSEVEEEHEFMAHRLALRGFKCASVLLVGIADEQDEESV